MTSTGHDTLGTRSTFVGGKTFTFYSLAKAAKLGKLPFSMTCLRGTLSQPPDPRAALGGLGEMARLL